MKKSLILFIVLFISALYTYAQMPLMKAVTDKVNTLKQARIDTIITYHPYCVGCILTGISDSSKCYHNIKQYIIWKRGGESFVQLFDECYTYKPQKAPVAFMSLINEKVSVIMEERLLPVEFEKVVNGKVQKGTYRIAHSDYQNLVFHIDGKIIEKPVDKFILNTQWVDDLFPNPGDRTLSIPPAKVLNVNYEKNQKTYLKKLVDVAELEIEKIAFTKAP